MKNDETKYLCWRVWNPITKTIMYAASLPGDDGKDWGYTKKLSQALPLSLYWKRRFFANALRCNDRAQSCLVNGDWVRD